jgi:hypothetical protein
MAKAPEKNLKDIMKFCVATISKGANSRGAHIPEKTLQKWLAKYRPKFGKKLQSHGPLKEGLKAWSRDRPNVRRAGTAHGIIAAELAKLWMLSTGRNRKKVVVTTRILMDLAAPLIESECKDSTGAEGPWCT